MGKQSGSPAPLTPLAYRLSEVYCEPDLAEALTVTVTEVLGSSASVVPGGSYLVRGQYELRKGKSDVACLRLAAQGASRGREARLGPGRGEFSISADVAEVVEGREGILDVLMADKREGHLGVRVRIELDG